MDFQITLQRDSLSTPWGFRLEGGKDFKAPLTIQRVFAGTPASSDLMRADIITSIHNEDASFLFHQEANELIRNSGGSLVLGIRRNPANATLQFQPFQSYQKKQGFGIPIVNNKYFSTFTLPTDDDIHNRYRSHQIEKYSNPKPILSQTGSSHLPNYQPFTVGECSSVQRFTQSKGPHVNIMFANPSYPKIASTNACAAPYMDRRMIGNIQQNLTRAVHAPVTMTSYLGKSMGSLNPQDRMKVGKYEVKTFSNNMNFSKAPSQASDRSQNQFSTSSNPQPRIVTKQYNSPMGLYSNSTMKEEFTKQSQAADHFNNQTTNSSSEF